MEHNTYNVSNALTECISRIFEFVDVSMCRCCI